MAKCPHCNSKNTSWTNYMEVIGANAAGAVAGCVMNMLSPNLSNAAHYESSRNLCPYKEYLCNDCGKKFTKNRRTGTVS